MDIEALLKQYPSRCAAQKAYADGMLSKETWQLLNLYYEPEEEEEEHATPAGHPPPDPIFEAIQAEYEDACRNDPEPVFESFMHEDKFPSSFNREKLENWAPQTRAEHRERKATLAYLNRAQKMFETQLANWRLHQQARENTRQLKIDNLMRDRQEEAARFASAADTALKEQLKRRIRDTVGVNVRSPADNVGGQIVSIPLEEYYEMKERIATLTAQLARRATERPAIKPQRHFRNPQQKTCLECGQPFTALREHGKYCSSACRLRAAKTNRTQGV